MRFNIVFEAAGLQMLQHEVAAEKLAGNNLDGEPIQAAMSCASITAFGNTAKVNALSRFSEK